MTSVDPGDGLFSARPGLHWKVWEAEAIVYNPFSGEIHLLNDTGAEALRMLEMAPGNAGTLLEQFAASPGVDDREVFLEHLKRLLWEFDELGLLEPVVAIAASTRS